MLRPSFPPPISTTTSVRATDGPAAAPAGSVVVVVETAAGFLPHTEIPYPPAAVTATDAPNAERNFLRLIDAHIGAGTADCRGSGAVVIRRCTPVR